ncbi:LacI family DNA-binding transcriptional regulator [Paenibacillus sp. MMS18-CY102]|uniref:LacI family DNA-binding transcriptional regulator n=1 Tax=Paenibacillus sp. MMS18-CY102 TaxID=2682849 RepID=UPI0013659D3B|nr:LacI family DNA-binding transcriptional regulator [Paenibacillus sp. MMS18-CY102]MWC26900.1 LacI family DNA-binding transcriptional regulator [Paenibacillus sp. MMS18-CY102]
MVDVAQRANVSTATVSRVLNDSSRVSAKTKQKVLKAIEEMNYIPNASAKSLRSQKTRTIAVVVSDIHSSYFAEIVKGIENMANSRKYRIVICDTQNEREKEVEMMSLALDRTVDAMVFVAPIISNEEIEAFVDRGYTVGVIGRHIDHPNVPCAYTDNVKISQEVIAHLLEKGHSRIAFLSGYADSTDSHERLEGYMKALTTAQLTYDPALIENGQFNENGGYDAFHRLWAKSIGITAIFAANDEMALGVYRACRELGIMIPEQLTVIGVDNNRVAKYITPKLSTVEQPKYAMGALLVEKLIDQMNDNDYIDQRVFKVDSKLILRESSSISIDRTGSVST